MVVPEAIVKPASEALVGAAIGTAVLIGTTISRVHRDGAHRSIHITEPFGHGLDALIGPYTDRAGWSATHRFDHHGKSDTNFLPIKEKYDYALWCEQHPDRAADLPLLQDFYDGLDPVARRVSRDTVLEMGRLISSEVVGLYVPPNDYTLERAVEITRDEPSAYTYKNIDARARRPTPRQWPKGYQPTLQDRDYKLMDPHSPALLEHGAFFKPFVRYMVPLYRGDERMWDSNTELPEDLHRDSYQQYIYDHREVLIKLYSAALVLGTVGLKAAMGERSMKEIIVNALVGGGIAAGMGGGLVAGGLLTNYIGHLGADPYYTMRSGILIPQSDGTLATNGNLLFAWLTGDEAGWQGNHHAHPEWIAFAKKFYQAPFGTVFKKLAEKKWLGFREGSGFSGARPDTAHAATVMMEQERVRTVAAGLYYRNRQEAERCRVGGKLAATAVGSLRMQL